MLINRCDKFGNYLRVGDTLINSIGKVYKVVFAEDILAFGIVDEYGLFEFMSEWVADEWEVI